MKDKILSVTEVAKIRGVGAATILVAIRKGDLKATYFHGEWHIRESNYHEYEKKYCQELNNQKFITLNQASSILKISEAIILRAIQKGIITTRQYKQGFKVSLESLLEWERKNFVRD